MESIDHISKEILSYRTLAFSSVFIGFLFMVFFGFNITGNAVSETDFYLDNLFGFFAGIGLLILSFFAFKALRNAEEKLKRVKA